MPKGYLRMRNKFRRQGMSMKAAKKKAARIWNKSHKSKVSRKCKHK